jgi:hypothetical protein
MRVLVVAARLCDDALDARGLAAGRADGDVLREDRGRLVEAALVEPEAKAAHDIGDLAVVGEVSEESSISHW